MSLLNDAFDELAGLLEDAGLPVIQDVRNLRPPSVLVDPPTITAISGDLVKLDFPVVVVAPPPGNLDAVRVMLGMADTIVQAVPCTGGAPSLYSVGNQDLPAYSMTVSLTVRR